jgi:hypothetical protein
LSFGKFGSRLAFGDDAATRKEASGSAIDIEFCATYGHRPSAVAITVAPTNCATVTPSRESFMFGDELQCNVTWMSSERWCR